MSDPEFEALLDRLTEEFESQEDETPVDRHVWESEREVLFSCDDLKYRCTKCAVRLTVRMNQSIASAMEEQGVLSDCAEQLIQDVSGY